MQSAKCKVQNEEIGSGLVLHLALIVLCVGILAGCQTSTVTPVQKTTGNSAPLPTDHPPTADEAVANDPCATRLEDIEGALMMYFALNKRFPDTLEQLKPFADAGTELKLTCPVSNLPYVYSSAGLLGASNNFRVMVWDPTPAHKGMRWCIIMPSAAPGGAMVPQVVPIQEEVFLKFVPAIQ